MSDQKSSATKARGRARALLAERVAARRAAEKACEEDLAEFLSLIDAVDQATARRDAAMAAAKKSYDSAVEKAQMVHKVLINESRAAQAKCVRRLSDRGEKVSILAELTGLSAIEIGRLTRAGTNADANGTDGPGDQSESSPPPQSADTASVGERIASAVDRAQPKVSLIRDPATTNRQFISA